LGATSADTQREIAEIRKDVASALDELDARVRGTFDLGTQARAVQDSPATVAGVAVVGLVVGGFVAYKVVSGLRRRRRPDERLKRTVREAAEGLSERFERAREAIPVGIRLHAGDDDDENRTLEVQRSDPSMLKRILWAALAATMMAGAGLLARRLSAAVWKAAMNEEPPTAKV
jgi:hypothetical protein